jgi:hypothetical protein
MKKFLKIYFLDVILLVLLFLLGVFVKLRIGNFFTQVNSYQLQIQALESGLANQSTEALVQLQPIVNNFNSLVIWVYIFMILVVPLIVYFLFWATQALNVCIIKNKFTFKYFWKSFLFGLPFLIMFLLAISYFLEVMFNALTSWSSLGYLVLFTILFVLMSYAWFTGLVLLESHSLKVLYKKFFLNVWKFLILLFLVFVIFIVELLMLFRYLTSSFVGLDWLSYIILILIVLVGIEIVKIWYTNSFKAV